MEFREKLLKVGQALNRDDTKALVFLCKDILRCVNSVESPIDLFKRLEEKDVLSEDQPYLLADLLRVIEHFQLLNELDLQSKMSTTGSLISPYRKLLYKLSEDIDKKDLKKFKFLLNESTLEVFLEMERRDLLSSSKLDLLEQRLGYVCPVLGKHIQQFKASQGKIAQETGLVDRRPRSSSVSPHLGEDQTDPKRYPMKAQQRSFCLIVNNFDFSRSHGKLNNRIGTHIDEESLRRVFTWLGFQVEVLQDATRDQMLCSMRELASRDHSGMDCFACVVLSHGVKGGVYGVDGGDGGDGGVVPLEELTDLLNGVRCASLRGKPKLFFIQACQGTQREQAVPVQADGPVDPEVHAQTDAPSSLGVNAQTDGPRSPGDLNSDAVVMRESLPGMADFLISKSSPPSYVSLRDRKKGSWFIQSLCQKLVDMVPRNKDLFSILMEVNEDVSQKSDPTNRMRQMPAHTSTLRKLVFFPVPEDPPPSLPTSL